jgi:hypothetical protein
VSDKPESPWEKLADQTKWTHEQKVLLTYGVILLAINIMAALSWYFQ